MHLSRTQGNSIRRHLARTSPSPSQVRRFILVIVVRPRFARTSPCCCFVPLVMEVSKLHSSNALPSAACKSTPSLHRLQPRKKEEVVSCIRQYNRHKPANYQQTRVYIAWSGDLWVTTIGRIELPDVGRIFLSVQRRKVFE